MVGELESFGLSQFNMSTTEACVFFTFWQDFWSRWCTGEFYPIENIFDGKIKKDGAVFVQLKSFTDENGNPKKLPGFRGLYVILDEISNDDRMTELLFIERSQGCIEKMRMSLWLAEMMLAPALPTDRQTILQVKKAVSTLHPDFDWDRYFWSDYIFYQMVFNAIGVEQKLPKDALTSIANYLLPEMLKSVIVHCIFQLTIAFHKTVSEESDDDIDEHHDDADDSDEDDFDGDFNGSGADGDINDTEEHSDGAY